MGAGEERGSQVGSVGRGHARLGGAKEGAWQAGCREDISERVILRVCVCACMQEVRLLHFWPGIHISLAFIAGSREKMEIFTSKCRYIRLARCVSG